MDPTVTKIIVHSGKRFEWEVHVVRASKTGGTETIAVRSADEPTGAFLNALGELRKHFLYMLEAHQEWMPGFNVRRIDIDYSEHPPFYTLGAEKNLDGFDRPVKCVAPPAQFTGEALEDLRRVTKHALDYAYGKRAQLSLFDKEAKAKQQAKQSPAKQPPIKQRRNNPTHRRPPRANA